MSLSGTEIIFDEDSGSNTDHQLNVQISLFTGDDYNNSNNSNRTKHQTQSSLSAPIAHLTLDSTNKDEGSKSKTIDIIKDLTLQEDINNNDTNNKVTPSCSTSLLQSMQSQSTEYSIQNQIYLNSLKITPNASLDSIAFPLYEQENEHSNDSNSISISSKNDSTSLDTNIIYHDQDSLNINDSIMSTDDDINSTNISRLDSSRLDSTDSTFVGMDMNKIKIIPTSNTSSNQFKSEDEGNLVMIDEDEYNRDNDNIDIFEIKRGTSMTSDTSSCNDLFRHHRPPTDILNCIEEENLKLRELKNEQSSSNSSFMSDETETHHSKYLLNAGVAIDQTDDDDEELQKPKILKLTSNDCNNNNNDTKVGKTKLQKQVAKTVTARNLTDLINDIQEKQEVDICQKLEKKVTTEIERKWHERFNQQKLNSDLQIMRLQQQLSNLSQQLNETKRIHQQIALMHHSPLLNGQQFSNQTQRISISNISNMSRMSALTDGENEDDDDDEYNTSEDEHVEYNPNGAGTTINPKKSPSTSTKQTNKNRNKRRQSVNNTESPMVRIFNIPSNPTYLYSFNSNTSNGGCVGLTYSNQNTPNPIYIPPRPTPVNVTATINRDIAGYNGIPNNTTPILFDGNYNNGFPKVVDIKNKNKNKEKSPKKICDAKVEKTYLERKEMKNEKSFLWIWLNDYTCFNLRVCWKSIQMRAQELKQEESNICNDEQNNSSQAL